MRIINNKNLSASGFTLVEVMAAIMVLSIGLIGSLTVINYNLRNISSQESRIIAAKLAEEGIELVRNVRDTNWLQGAADWKARIEGQGVSKETIRFFCADTDAANSANIMPRPSGIDDTTRCSGAGADRPCQIYIYTKIADDSKCYSDNFGAMVGYSRVATDFFRLITLDELSSDSVKVNVDVKWVFGTQTYRVSASETLYNWK